MDKGGIKVTPRTKNWAVQRLPWSPSEMDNWRVEGQVVFPNGVSGAELGYLGKAQAILRRGDPNPRSKYIVVVEACRKQGRCE